MTTKEILYGRSWVFLFAILSWILYFFSSLSHASGKYGQEGIDPELACAEEIALNSKHPTALHQIAKTKKEWDLHNQKDLKWLVTQTTASTSPLDQAREMAISGLKNSATTYKSLMENKDLKTTLNKTSTTFKSNANKIPGVPGDYPSICEEGAKLLERLSKIAPSEWLNEVFGSA